MDVPPTVRDPEVEGAPEGDASDAGGGANGSAARKKRRWRWVVAVSLIALACVAGVGLYVYFRYIRYEATALRHVPDDVNIVLRADAVELITYDPVREHVWPALFDAAVDGTEDLEGTRRVKRLREETGIHVPVDLREAVVCSLDGRGWVVIIGGTFERGRFVTGLHRVLEEEGYTGWRVDGDLLLHATGFTISQADDGVLIFGTSKDIVRAALPQREVDADVPVPAEGAIAFYVNRRAWKGTVAALPLDLPGIDALDDVKQLSGSVLLAEKPKPVVVHIEVEPKEGASADKLAQDIDGMFGKFRLLLLLKGGDLGGGRQAIQEASVTSKNKKVHVETPWPYDAIEDHMKALASLIRKGGNEP